ncbi:multicopper oxidase [Ramaria rubella]|nr:multicopper oxidase [Ramaria rubella]
MHISARHDALSLAHDHLSLPHPRQQTAPTPPRPVALLTPLAYITLGGHPRSGPLIHAAPSPARVPALPLLQPQTDDAFILSVVGRAEGETRQPRTRVYNFTVGCHEELVVQMADWYHDVSGVPLRKYKYLAAGIPDLERGFKPVPDGGVHTEWPGSIRFWRVLFQLEYHILNHAIHKLTRTDGRTDVYSPSSHSNAGKRTRVSATSSESTNALPHLSHLTATTSAFATIRISIDTHPLTFIETDDTLLTPAIVSSVTLAVAQRYSVLVHANAAGNGAYWMRAMLQSHVFKYTQYGQNWDIRGVVRTVLVPLIRDMAPEVTHALHMSWELHREQATLLELWIFGFEGQSDLLVRAHRPWIILGARYVGPSLGNRNPLRRDTVLIALYPDVQVLRFAPACGRSTAICLPLKVAQCGGYCGSVREGCW